MPRPEGAEWGVISDSEKRIEDLLDRAERRIAAIFRTAINATRAELDLEKLADLLARGQTEEALDMLITIARQLGAASSAVFITAGQTTAQFLIDAGIGLIAFDQINDRAVRIMQAAQLELITQFSQEQRNAVRAVLTDGVSRGLGPIEQARHFRTAIGLTERQAMAVMNHRRFLEMAGDATLPNADQLRALSHKLRDKRFDAAIRRAATNNAPLDKVTIDRMVERYAQKYVKHRAEVIARTEALRAVHQGVNQAYDQAIDEGVLSADRITQKWTSARDGRVRDSHQKLNGQIRPIGGTWQGDYGTLRYPGDPAAPAAETIQCRCILIRRIARQ